MSKTRCSVVMTLSRQGPLRSEEFNGGHGLALAPEIKRRMARIEIEGAISSSTRQRVLKALREVQEREFHQLLRMTVLAARWVTARKSMQHC